MWTQQQAIEFCTQLEPIAKSFGFHVALTGGSLYKQGPRKDLDILLYCHSEPGVKNDLKGLFSRLGSACGLRVLNGFAVVVKCQITDGRTIDILTPKVLPYWAIETGTY